MSSCLHTEATLEFHNLYKLENITLQILVTLKFLKVV